MALSSPIRLPSSRTRPRLRHRFGTLVRLSITNYTCISTAGSEKYRSITTGHYRFALGAVLVYDVTNAESFKNCRYWVDSIRCYADENVVIALVGNKCDLAQLAPQRRQVKFEEARKFANENNLLFIGESSA